MPPPVPGFVTVGEAANRVVEQTAEHMALKVAVDALAEIATPAYGIGFRGLKQIAKRGLREVSAALRERAA